MGLADLTPEQLEQLANAYYSRNKPLNLGPFILGNVVDALLCGILLMQCGSYISLSARDGRLLKAIVAYVVIMNLWSTAFAWAWVWELFVRNFGTYLSWTFVIGTGNGFAVQTFFALRAWKILDRNRLFGTALVVLMLAFIGSGFAIKILYVRYPYTVYSGEMKVPAHICLSGLVAADVLITTTILWYLLSWRGINRHTNQLLKKLARVTFESQLPPTLIAIAILAVYTVQHDSFIMVPLIWAHPKLYGISLLHTLNMRSKMAQPTVIFGSTYSVPSSGGLGLSVATAQTAQAEPFNVIPHCSSAGDSQSRSYFPTQNESPKPVVVSSDEESVAAIPGDALKVGVMPVVSHSGSFDTEMVRVKSKPPGLGSHTAAG